MVSNQAALDQTAVRQAVEWNLLKSLHGQSFCMTGAMSMKRQNMELLIQMLGGSVHDAVRAGTDYLLIPNQEVRKGSKYQAALRAGKVILSEEDFCNMIFPTLDELLGGSDGTGRGKA